MPLHNFLAKSTVYLIFAIFASGSVHSGTVVSDGVLSSSAQDEGWNEFCDHIQRHLGLSKLGNEDILVLKELAANLEQSVSLPRFSSKIGIRTTEILPMDGLKPHERAVARTNEGELVLLGPLQGNGTQVLVSNLSGSRWESTASIPQLVNGHALVVWNEKYANRPSEVEIAPQDLNLGLLDLRTLVHSKSITLLNTGSESIAIEDVKFDCGCARATAADVIIGPYGAASLKIVIEPYGRPPGILNLKLLITAKVESRDAQHYVWPVEGQIGGVSYGFSSEAVSVEALPDGPSTIDVEAKLVSTAPAAKIQPVFLDKGLVFNGLTKLGNYDYMARFQLDLTKIMPDENGRFLCKAHFSMGNSGYVDELHIVGKKHRLSSVYPQSLFVSGCAPNEKIYRTIYFSNSNAGNVRSVYAPEMIDVEYDSGTATMTIETPSEKGIYREAVVFRDDEEYIHIPVLLVVDQDNR